MSIFVDENTKVIYQGLTGSQGKYYGLLNREYGTKVVAGDDPGGITSQAGWQLGDLVRIEGRLHQCLPDHERRR